MSISCLVFHCKSIFIQFFYQVFIFNSCMQTAALIRGRQQDTLLCFEIQPVFKGYRWWVIKTTNVIRHQPATWRLVKDWGVPVMVCNSCSASKLVSVASITKCEVPKTEAKWETADKKGRNETILKKQNCQVQREENLKPFLDENTQSLQQQKHLD